MPQQMPQNEPDTHAGNIADFPIEDTDLVSDTPVEEIEEPIVSDLPQELTESYGTGVAFENAMASGGRTQRTQRKPYNATGPELTGGDVDAGWQQAHLVGDEAVGGTVATPDQNVVDDLGYAMGLDYNDDEDLQTNEILEARDSDRWELDPLSAEDH